MLAIVSMLRFRAGAAECRARVDAVAAPRRVRAAFKLLPRCSFHSAPARGTCLAALAQCAGVRLLHSCESLSCFSCAAYA